MDGLIYISTILKMMKKRHLILILITSVVAAVVLFGIFRPSEKVTTIGQITIGYPTLRIALPVFVAQEKGYFKHQGLNVQLQKYETAQPMMDALVSGSIDIAGFAALPITFAAMARSKTKLIFLAGMFENDAHPISILIVKKGSTLQSIQDLKGKRIGILPTRAYEVWLQKILLSNEVNFNDVTIQQIATNFQTDALNSGSVDALFTNDPASTVVIAKGVGISFSSTVALVPKSTGFSPFYFGSFNIAEKFAKEHPVTVKKIAAALDDAIRYINTNPDSAQMTMTKYLPEPMHKFVSKFPKSFFKTVNEVTNADLKMLKDYYFNERVLPVDINIQNLQYKY